MFACMLALSLVASARDFKKEDDDMRKFFGFSSATPPPPPPPARPPAPPVSRPAASKTPAPAKDASHAPPTAIVGRWKAADSADTTEFRADGNVIESLGSGDTIRGRYSLEGAKLKINLEGVPEALSFSAAIAADKLEMRDPDGQVTEYRRL